MHVDLLLWSCTKYIISMILFMTCSKCIWEFVCAWHNRCTIRHTAHSVSARIQSIRVGNVFSCVCPSDMGVPIPRCLAGGWGGLDSTCPPPTDRTDFTVHPTWALPGQLKSLYRTRLTSLYSPIFHKGQPGVGYGRHILWVNWNRKVWKKQIIVLH